MKILISGYPYVRENFLNTFRDGLNGGEVFFLLPEKWPIKKGKFVYTPPKHDHIFTTSAFFHHSHYPIVGGLLKGFMPYFPLALRKLKKRGICLVFTPTEPVLLSTLYQGIWAKIFGLKHVIFTWENIPYDKKFRGLNLLIKKLFFSLNMFFADGIVCGNEKSAEIHRKLTDRRLAVIPLSGVDTNFFKPESGTRGDAITFLFVGAMSRHKGVFTLLDALASLVADNRQVKLIMAGSGDDDEAVATYIKEKNLSDNVIRLPWIDHEKMRNLLHSSDVFVYPSVPTAGWEEQFGYSMAEASATGLPVIATNTGSISEVILDGQTGILVRQDSSEALTSAMIKLTDDTLLRDNMGRAGRDFICKNFSYDVVANSYRSFFESI